MEKTYICVNLLFVSIIDLHYDLAPRLWTKLTCSKGCGNTQCGHGPRGETLRKRNSGQVELLNMKMVSGWKPPFRRTLDYRSIVSSSVVEMLSCI
jgi:hypothetical protein